MIDSLRQSLTNLRDGLHAAGRSAIELRAPLGVRRRLERSVRLLDRALTMAAAQVQETSVRMALWTPSALAQAREALLAWQAWVDGALPSGA